MLLASLRRFRRRFAAVLEKFTEEDQIGLIFLTVGAGFHAPEQPGEANGMGTPSIVCTVTSEAACS